MDEQKNIRVKRNKSAFVLKLSVFIRSHEFLCLCVLCIFISFLRFLYCGFEYAFTLDDYIQYHNYASATDYWKLIIQEGLFASRPLAVIADLFIYAPLFDHMIIGVLLNSILFGLSGMLFYASFSRLFGTGKLFIFFYLLLPLNFEATYWLSASSRIVSGLFYTSLSLYLFIVFIKTKRTTTAVAACVLQLISISFYEQIFILSLALWLMTALIFLLKKIKTSYLGLISVVNAAVYFAFTRAFAGGGAISARMELCLPTSSYYFKTFFPDISRQIGAAFIKGGIRTLFTGFIRGIKLIVTENGWLYLLICVAMSLLIYYFCRISRKFRKASVSGKESRPHVNFTAAVYGFLAMLAPVTPFLIIANPWFSLRSTAASIVGAAVLIDLLFRMLIRNKRRTFAAVCAAFSLVSLIAAASETYDYMKTYELDKIVLRETEKAVKSGAASGKTGILNLNSSLLDEQNFLYHEHVTGVFSSEWAFYGAMVYTNGGELSYPVVPLPTNGYSYYHGWDKNFKILSQYDSVLYWDNLNMSLNPLVKEKIGEEDYMLYTQDGKIYAHVFEEDGYGYINFAENSD